MFSRGGSIKLMNAFGIRIGVDASWFLLLFLIIFWLSGPFRDVLHSSDTTAYVTTVVTVLLYFGSLIVHELGHAIVARRQGIEVKRIELFLFGGLTSMSRDTSSPAEELKVAIAGPVGTFLFLVLCLAVDLVVFGPHQLWHAVRLEDQYRVTPVMLSLSWLVTMNVVILVFNLMPAFPLDGGRIARALVWKRTGDKARGTRASAKLGQGFGIVLAGLGIAWALNGDALNGLWLIALAFMMYQSAQSALAQSAVDEQIDGVKVADVMDTAPVTIPAQTAVGAAVDEYFQRYGWPWFAVIDEHGRYVGIATAERVQATLARGEGWLTVGACVEPELETRYRVSESEQLSAVMGSEALGRLGALMAVDGDGVLRGVVTIEQISRALQSALGARA